jgi:magnesium transporter
MPLFGELFLSEIVRKPVLDPKGEEVGVLRDVSVVKGETFPKISSIIVEKRKKTFAVPWNKINIFNKRVMSINVYSGSLVPYELSEEDLLVRRDILDKQIVDANGAKVVRVNDVKLEGLNNDALLVAVDVGMRGILRRMGFERRGEDLLRLLRIRLGQNLISWNYIQPLQSKLSEIALNIPGEMVSELHPADLADLISQVSHEEGAQFIEGLDIETAADAIAELEPDTQKAMFTDMDVARAADIIEEMDPDTAADVIGSLPTETARAILAEVEREEAQDIQELLNHESDTAGGIMTNDFLAYPPDITVEECLKRYRVDAEEIDSEAAYYMYVIDAEDRILGATSLRDVLLAEPGKVLAEIMETNVKTVTPEADEMTTAVTIAKYNLIAIPVVDSESYLLGIVTLDDVVDRMVPSRAKRKLRSI